MRPIPLPVLLLGALFFALASLAQASPSVTLVSNDAALTNPWQMASDGSHLYVTNDNSILKLPLGGGTPSVLYRNVAPIGILHLDGNLYWIDPNGDPDATAIFRAPASGGTVSKIYSGSASGQPIVDGSGLTSDGTKLYSADEVQGRIHSMNLDGSGIVQLGSRYGGFFDIEHLNTIAYGLGILHEPSLFVADSGEKGNCNCGTTPPQVVTLPASGGGITTLHSGAPFVDLTGIAVSATNVYVADRGANTVWSMPLQGGTPSVLVSGAPFVQIGSVLLVGDTLYVSDLGDRTGTTGPGAIYKVELNAAPASAGTLQFSSTSYNVGENAGSLTLTVTRTGGSGGFVTALVSLADVTAKAGQDYGAASQTISFADGDTAPKSLFVTILNDNLAESDETFRAVLAEPTGGAALGTPATTVVTITISDDDTTPGSPFAIAGTPSGTLDKLSLTATLQVATQDSGRSGVIYLAALFNDVWYFKEASGMWTLWHGGALPAPYFTGTLGNHTIPVLQGMDARLLVGVEIYVGYGLDSGDMLFNAKYKMIHKVSPETCCGPADLTALIGTWKQVASTDMKMFPAGSWLTVSTAGTIEYKMSDCTNTWSLVSGGSTYTMQILSSTGCATPGTTLQGTFVQSGDTLKMWVGNAEATFQKSASPPPVRTDTVSIEGTIYDASSGAPLAGAVISTSLDGETATTDAAGHFLLITRTGPTSDYGTKAYTLVVAASGYQTFNQTHTWGGNPTQQTFRLDKMPIATMTSEGYIRGTNNAPIPGATITFISDGSSATTDGSGHFYLLTRTPQGNGTTPYTLVISAPGYPSKTLTLTGDHPTGQVFYLDTVTR